MACKTIVAGSKTAGRGNGSANLEFPGNFAWLTSVMLVPTPSRVNQICAGSRDLSVRLTKIGKGVSAPEKPKNCWAIDFAAKIANMLGFPDR